MTGIPDADVGTGFRVHLHWLSDKFPDLAHVLSCFHHVWSSNHGLAWLGNVRLSIGRMPREYPASYAHIFVGCDLSWHDQVKYPDGSPVGPIGGWGPHWFGHYVGEPWTVRGAFVDDVYCLSPLALGDLIIHEVGHLLIGDRWHAVEPTPARVAELKAGAAKAEAWATKLNRTGKVE